MLCGVPSSGKTTRAKEILQYFKDTAPNQKIHLVGDEELLADKNLAYKGMKRYYLTQHRFVQ
jgi:tRNA uridine 5-carbamoylmethylation protein Kti12